MVGGGGVETSPGASVRASAEGLETDLHLLDLGGRGEGEERGREGEEKVY